MQLERYPQPKECFKVMKLGVIDYGAGNLCSVLNTFQAAGVTGHLIRKPEDTVDVTHLVLPGVGAFGDCAEKLRSQGLEPLIRNWIAQDKPFLGICVGYQVLFESGEEDERVPGLGIFKGRVVRFVESELKVPHMGWNKVTLANPTDPIWAGMGNDPYFYFVHSYYPKPEDESVAAAFCSYGVRFAAAIRRGNLLATQFHPEKSQKLGVRLLKNFASL